MNTTAAVILVGFGLYYFISGVTWKKDKWDSGYGSGMICAVFLLWVAQFWLN